MMMPFLKTDDMNTVKNNVSSFTDHFAEDDNTWLQKELGRNIFSDSKFPMPQVSLDMSNDVPPDKTDPVNVQAVYSAFQFLSDSQASDERLWSALCLGPFWTYVQYRWKVKKNHSKENILQHYFFGFGARRSLTRNAMSRLWWTGRLTYDKTDSDPYHLTRFVTQNARFIVDILERNTSNNPEVLRPFIQAVIDAQNRGIPVSSERIRDLAIYLDELGGIYILDCLPEQKIHDRILKKAEELAKKDEKAADTEDMNK